MADAGVCQFIGFVLGGLATMIAFMSTEHYSWNEPRSPEKELQCKRFRQYAIVAWVILGLPGLIRLVIGAYMGIVL